MTNTPAAVTTWVKVFANWAVSALSVRSAMKAAGLIISCVDVQVVRVIQVSHSSIYHWKMS